ncbi:hypothetical protein LCGC14_0430470 [marine sediment metagenome]|uniref:Rad50/SbcC-type AAA domain-containing protein n=1 Tax=marine sediment metagenome TaxID=412755 RepID=A0A0F9SUD1_9ZZZZ
MPVTGLRADNVKGMTFQETLTGRDIYVGENGVGKSARLQAFVFGIQGYLPSPFKKGLGDTFQIASGDAMSVSIETDEMFSFSRQIRRKTTNHKDGTKSYSYTSACSIFPDQGTKTNKDRERRISQAMGGFAVMFDLDEFMSMSDTKKREFVFSLSSPESYGWDRSRIYEELCESLGHAAPIEWNDKIPVAENISSLLEETSKKLSDARAVYKDKQKVKVEVIEMRQRATQEAVGDIAEIRGTLKSLREKRSEYDKEIAKAEEIKRQHDSLRDRISKLDKSRSTLDEGTLPDLGEAEKKVSDGNKGISMSEELAEDEEEKLDGYRSQLSETQEILSNTKEQLARIDQRQAIRDQINIISAKGCPLMGDQCESDLSAYKGSLEEKWQGVDDEVKILREKRDGIQADCKQIEEWAAASSKRLKNHKGCLKEWRKAVKGADKELVEVKNCHNARELDQLAVESEEELIQDVRSNLGAIVDTGMAVKAVAGIMDQISELEEKEKKAQEIKNVMANFDQANIAAAEAEEEVETLAKLRKALGSDGIQAEILKDVIGPLADTVNGLLSQVVPGEKYSVEFELYDMNGKDTFEIIWPRKIGRVSYNTLSGGQQILFGAALMIALILQADPPLKAMCIEAAELDAENFFSLLDALDEIAGGIDNILIATCNDKVIEKKDTVADKWEVVHLD